jgi:hypothetical protein
MNTFLIFTVTVYNKRVKYNLRIQFVAMFAVLDIQNTFRISYCHIYILSPCTISLAPPQSSITHRHQITCAERHNNKYLSLCNTKHSLDKFWFLLQDCRYLREAAKSGGLNRTKILVKCTNDSCTADYYFRNTPLICAADNGHVEVVQLLLEGGVNVEWTNIFRWTALHRAAYNGHLDVCRLLLDSGAKVDPVDLWNETPLHDAARRGHLSVIKLLVERGADVRLKSENGQTARDKARIKGHRDVVDWLDSVSRV